MRLIDADSFQEALHKRVQPVGLMYGFDIELLIKNAPTVKLDINDTEYKAYSRGLEDGKKITRPKGEWIFLKANEEQTDGYECSVCKTTYHTKVPYFSEFNFCPNCGADMREGGAV